MNNRQHIYKIAAIFLIADQLIKIIIKNTMNLFQEITVIPNFFSLIYTKNTGAAFSILSNATVFLIIISVVFVLIIDKYIKKEQSNFTKLSNVSFGMILGGILGNLMDRVLYHGVIDYLSFTFFDYHFAIFNLADIGITIGAMILLIDMWKRRD